MNRLRFPALIGLIGLMGLIAGPAHAVREAALDGHWMGFGQSGGPIPVPYPVEADIVGTKNRRFMVNVLLPAVQRSLKVDGTISDSGNVNIQGRDGEFHMDAHGKLAIVQPGPPGTNNLPAVQLVALRYFLDGSRSHDDGFILLVQAQGGTNWQNPGPQQTPVDGHWMGDWKSASGGIPGGGCIEMDLRQFRTGGGIDNPNGGTLTSAFGGMFHMEDVLLPYIETPVMLVFDAVGTVGVPAVQKDGSKVSSFGAIGLCPSDPSSTAIIAILIGLLTESAPINEIPPVCNIRGGYALYGSFFDIFTEIPKGGNTSFDMGTFMVTPGPDD